MNQFLLLYQSFQQLIFFFLKSNKKDETNEFY